MIDVASIRGVMAGEQNMTDGLSKHLEGLINALHAAESEEKKRYNNAIDIEDMAEATAVTIDARSKILKLRKWIEQLQSVNNEITETYDFASAPKKSENASVRPPEEPSTADAIPEFNGANSRFEAITLADDIFADESSDNAEGNTISPTATTLTTNGFVLFGASYPVSDLSALFVSFCEVLILHHPYKLALLGGMRIVDKQGHLLFSLNEHEVQEPRHKLSNGFFTSTFGSDNDIKLRCEHILLECGLKAETLKFY